MSQADQRPLGDALVRMGLLTAGQLESMLAVQRREGRPLSKQLVDSGFLTEERLIKILGEQLGVETIDLTDVFVHERVKELVLASVARRHSVLPIARRRIGAHDALLLAMVDPLDDDAVAVVTGRLPSGMRIVRLLAGGADLQRAFDQVYGPDDEAREVADDRMEASTRKLASFPTSTSAPSTGVTGFVNRAQNPPFEPDTTLEEMDAQTDADIPADPFGDRPTAPTVTSTKGGGADAPGSTDRSVPASRRSRPREPRLEAATQPVEIERFSALMPGASASPSSGAEDDPANADDPSPIVTPVVQSTPSGGTRIPVSRPGGPPVRRTPATEVVRTRGSGRRMATPDPRRPGLAGDRDVTRKVATPRPATPAVAPVATIPRKSPAARPTSSLALERVDDGSASEAPRSWVQRRNAALRPDAAEPEILVRAVVRRLPTTTVLVVGVASLLMLGVVGVMLFRMPPTVEAQLGPTGMTEPSAPDSSTKIVAEEDDDVPNPPLAPIRRIRPAGTTSSIVDRPPPPEHRFVLTDGLELRATAAPDAEALLWLKGGQLVRVLRRVGNTELVMVLPEGPAGFVSPNSLGERRPLSAWRASSSSKTAGWPKGRA